MPTPRPVTIKSSGGNYTSLSGAEAGEQAIGFDLPTRDEIMQFECYTMTDTTNVTIDGWNTDATRYIEILTPASDHLGFFLDVGSGYGIDLVESFVRIRGIKLRHTYSSGTWRGILVRPPSGAFYISHCVFTGVLTGTASGRAIEHFDSSTLRIWNCAFIDWKNGATAACDGVLVDAGGSNTSYIYNCTARNCLNGFRRASGVALAKNCATEGCTDGFNGTFNASSTNNASDIASDAPGGNSQTGTVTFVAGTGEYHLDASDTVAKDHGTDLSVDPNLAFSDDIDGVTRSGTWDIGADEVTGAGAPFPTSLLRGFQHVY
jgi:hypothetical protein